MLPISNLEKVIDWKKMGGSILNKLMGKKYISVSIYLSVLRRIRGIKSFFSFIYHLLSGYHFPSLIFTPFQRLTYHNSPFTNFFQVFDLNLEYGFYNIDFDRSGNFLALGGSKGHVAIMDWKKKELKCEFNAKEKIEDIVFLQNYSRYAVAQKRNLYIYDNTGTEIHRLKDHPEPIHLGKLQISVEYHFKRHISPS